MGFERSQFGNGTLVGSGGNVTQNVHNHYGKRESEGADGVLRTAGSRVEASWEVDATSVGSAAAFDQWLVQPKIPAGASIETVFVKVKEAFALGGTTPTILFGTDGSEVTNGFVISEAQAEATGTYDVTSTLTGTWDAPLAAETTVGVALGGTSPTVGTAGLLEVVVTYVVV